MFVILMNAETNNLKVALCKLGLMYSKSCCWQTNADRMFKLVLLETAKSLVWNQINSNFKNYEGKHWQQTTTVNIMILGSNANKVTKVTPANIRISFKKLSF